MMQAHASDQIRRAGHTLNTTSHSSSLDRRTQSEGMTLFYMSLSAVGADPCLESWALRSFSMSTMLGYLGTSSTYADLFAPDSWVEISSQPSSSSLSSVGDEIVTTGLRVQHDPRTRRRRLLRQNAPSGLSMTHRALSRGATSSQEEYEESESESDRVMTSSGEAPAPLEHLRSRPSSNPGLRSIASEDRSSSDDENRTAINYPINSDQCFTPQPNAFSHPPTTGHLRAASENVPGSYFPNQRRPSRPSTRHSLPGRTPSHLPQNILSPSFNAAAHHDEALRASLSTLQSFAVAARGLQKPDSKQRPGTQPQPTRSNKVEPMSFSLVPESAMQQRGPETAASPPQLQEPMFKPTIRRSSTSTSASASQHLKPEHTVHSPKRRSRPLSRERRAVKKARRASSSEDLQLVSPTLMTWLVSAGVVVFLSALSFGAGYSVGREAGRLEAGALPVDEPIRGCAREAGRSGLGLRRSLARSAVQV